MAITVARITELSKALEELDKAISSEQVTYGVCKNNAMEREDEQMVQYFTEHLDDMMRARSAIDTVIEFIDECEVRVG